MKKKIGDLTLKELAKYCLEQRNCDKCPIKATGFCYVKPYRHLDGIILDQEIEVEEDENNICDTCKLNQQCPLNHKPSLQCPYDNFCKEVEND